MATFSGGKVGITTHLPFCFNGESYDEVSVMSENNFYVYIHCRKSDGVTFYVGKGSGDRITSKSSRNKHWHNTVNKHGFFSKLIAANLNEKEAFLFESLLIKKLGRVNSKTGILVNCSEGGEGVTGYNHTKESKKIISVKAQQAHIDKKEIYKAARQKSKQKISDTLKSHYAKKEEWIIEKTEKMKETHRLDENREKSRLKQIEVQNRPEVKAKLIASWRDEDVRNRRLIAQKIAFSSEKSKQTKRSAAIEVSARPEIKEAKSRYAKLRALAAKYYGVHYFQGGAYVDRYLKEASL
jgi:hypothetical protein